MNNEPASEAKKRPDFPQWIETKDGKDCLAWPISEVKYLHNRLFWAFDAGRNCVWDQYISQKEEITRLKAELERERELRKEFAEWSKALISDVHFQERYPGVSNGLQKLLK